MCVLSNFLQAVAYVLKMFLDIYSWLIIIRALLSWVSPDPYNPIVQFIERSTEPVLAPFRRLIPSYKIGIDLSPLLALAAIYFLRIFLVSSLFDLAVRLQ